MNPEDTLSPFHVWDIDDDLPVKTTRPQKCRIKYIRSIGRCQKNHTFVRLKAIHFDEECIKGLFTFIMPTTKPCPTMSSDSIDFVYEDYTGGVFLALLKKVTNPRSTNTDKHFDKIRTRHLEEGTLCFSSNCSC